MNAMARGPVLDLTQINVREVANNPISPEEQLVFQYFRNTEGNTPLYLDNLSVNPDFLDDPILKYFQFNKWLPEEKAHEDFWGIILDNAPVDENLSVGLPLIDLAPTPKTRVGKLKDSITGMVMNHGLTHLGKEGSHDLTAVEMAWGMAQEALTKDGYKRLEKRTNHPVVRQHMPTIAGQESVHCIIYARQAFLRMAGVEKPKEYEGTDLMWRPERTNNHAARIQKLTRIIFDKFLTPVGEGESTPEAFGFVASMLMLPIKDDNGRPKHEQSIGDTVDAKIARLPGQAGSSPMTSAIQKRVDAYEQAVGLKSSKTAIMPLLSGRVA